MGETMKGVILSTSLAVLMAVSFLSGASAVSGTVSGARGQAGIISVDETGCSAEVLTGIPPELFGGLRRQMMTFLMSFLGSVWTLLPLSMIQFVLSIPVAVLTNFFALCSAAVIDLYQEVIGTVCDLTLCAGLAAAGAAGLIQSCILLCAGIMTCTPAALVDAAQSCSYWCGDLCLATVDLVWEGIDGLLASVQGAMVLCAALVADSADACIGTVWNAEQTCSYWCGDLYLLLSTYLRDALVFVSSGVGNYVWNSWQEIIGTISALWAGFNDIDIASYCWQSAKIMGWAAFSTIFRYTHLLRVIGTYIPCWGYAVTCFRGFAQLCLLWNNCFVRLGQHAVPVI